MSFGGGDGNTTTTQKFEPPSYTQPGWNAYIQGAQDLASTPYQQYALPQVAPLNSTQLSGLSMATDWGMNGDPTTNAARQTALGMSQGNFVGKGPQANVQPGTNPLMGSNAWLNQTIGDTASNMAQAHALGTAAQSDAAAAMQGAYGGSNWANLQAQNASNLQRNVGQMANQARFGDYANQQQMQEAAVNRGLQAQQFNAGQNMGQYNSDISNMMQAVGMAPQWAALDQAGIRAVTGAGDALAQYQQNLMNSAYNQFQQQNNYPAQQLETLGSALSRASGTYGGGGMQTATQQLPGMSPLAGLLGLGAGAYSASQFFK